MMHQFISPRSTTEDGRRQEFILNVILLTSIVLLSLLDISLVTSKLHHGSAYDGIPFEVLLVFIVAFSVLLFLSRKGHYLVSSYLLVAIYLSLTLYGVLTWSFVLPMIILGAITTIVATSILLGTRASFFLTGFIAVATATITFLQIRNVIPVELYWKKDPLQVGDAVEISIIFFVIATLSWLSNREMEASLKRARASEKLLKQERDALEERVEQRTRELKENQSRQIEQLGRLAELGQLSSGIFHDLMNPLNSVITSIANVEHNPHLADIKQSVIKAVEASRRMGSVLQTARKQLRPTGISEVFSAQKELLEAVDILTYKARCSNVTLKVNTPRDARLFGVALKFHQVALNLIANAIDSYDAAASGTKTVTISLFKRNGFTILKVTDHGCGIPEHMKQRIFEAFYTTKKNHGLGLGLATVKTVVEKDFGGLLEVRTNPDGGTSFSAFFPIHSHK